MISQEDVNERRARLIKEEMDHQVYMSNVNKRLEALELIGKKVDDTIDQFKRVNKEKIPRD